MFKYHPPIEVKVAAPIKVEEKTITYNDPIVPTAYIEKPPFRVRIKDHAKASTVVRKSNIKTYTPPEQVKVEPNIAIVKDILSDNIDGHVIYFCDEAARIARPNTKNKHRPVIGMHVISVKIGDHCYHGLCDMGASASAIPHSLYKEIMHDIAPAEIEEIDVTIKLANRDTISPIGIVTDVEVLCGKVKYPADFLVLGSPQDDFCRIIFGRPFLNTVNAKIDCNKDIVSVGLGDMSHEFNFSKFHRQPHDKELPSKDEIIGYRMPSGIAPSTKITKQDIIDFVKNKFTNDYVVVYKKRGEDKNVEKVVKPEITPVEVNRDKSSPFLNKIVNAKVTPIAPVFTDYKKEI